MDNKYTISFDEKVKGWTSFHSFHPDVMVGLNNQFFSLSGGNLYLHHSDNVKRNTYYGKQYPSKVSAIINDSPSEIKELKAISLEGNTTWETLIRAYISNVDDYIESTVKEVEFVKKEGIWYAYARRNEDSTHTDSKSVYGIGVVEKIGTDNKTITVSGYSDIISEGDMLIKGEDFTTVERVHNVNRGIGGKSIITLENPVVGSDILKVGDYVCGMKNSRIEGGNLRGYSMRFDMETNNDEKVELFAVNAEVIKSYQ